MFFLCCFTILPFWSAPQAFWQSWMVLSAEQRLERPQISWKLHTAWGWKFLLSRCSLSHHALLGWQCFQALWRLVIEACCVTEHRGWWLGLLSQQQVWHAVRQPSQEGWERLWNFEKQDERLQRSCSEIFEEVRALLMSEVETWGEVSKLEVAKVGLGFSCTQTWTLSYTKNLL